MHHLKVLRYNSCVTRDHTVLPAIRTQTIPAFTPQPQGITAFWPVPTCTAWWTEAHRCEKHAQSFYAACPAETRTHDLLIASPILYRQCHDATQMLWVICLFVSIIVCEVTDVDALCRAGVDACWDRCCKNTAWAATSAVSWWCYDVVSSACNS